jgi:predicted nucleotidyltransferase
MYRQEIREAGKKISAKPLLLFGSVARGEETPESDLDILVELPIGSDPLAADDLGAELEALLKVHVDVLSTRVARPEVLEQALRCGSRVSTQGHSRADVWLLRDILNSSNRIISICGGDLSTPPREDDPNNLNFRDALRYNHPHPPVPPSRRRDRQWHPRAASTKPYSDMQETSRRPRDPTPLRGMVGQ